MYTLQLQADRNVATYLQRRRDRELQRRERIFNSKLRTIGIDKDALAEQVKDKKAKEQEEVETLQAYSSQLLRNDQVACLLEERQQKDKRRLCEAIQQFRQDFQQPEGRREFDLSDPERLHKQDGVMVLPGLAGEDPDCGERRKRQQEQLRDWCLQQQQELEAAKQKNKLEEQQYNKNRVNQDNRVLALQKIEEERRKAFAVATANFNLAKAAEVANRRQQEKQYEVEDNQADILNQLQGRLLSENRDIWPRPQTWSFKGMHPEQLRQIRETQRHQMEQKRRACLEQQQQEAQDARLRQATTRTALLQERQQARMGKQLRLALDSANAQLAQAQQAHKKYLEKQVFTNVPEDGYFAQFNTTSR